MSLSFEQAMRLAGLHPRDVVDAERLRELLHYDQESGVFTRRFSIAGKRVGSVCGAPQNQGYVQVMVDKKNYLAHRLAWLYVTGQWPTMHIDHIDGNRTNNSFANLREASRQTNAQNIRQSHFDNRTGLLGVTHDKARGKFAATIYVNGRKRHLGRFATAEQAHAAYLKAKRATHDGCTL